MISPATIDEFQDKGVTVLRGVFSEWVDTLRAGVDYNMVHPGPDGRFYTDDKTSGRFLTDYCNWDRIPQYREFIFNSDAAQIGAALMGSQSVQLFHEHVLVKEAANGLRTPWHQDQPYYCVQCPQTVSIWVPLDPIPRERTLEFIAGSHKWGKLFRPERFNGTALNEDDGMDSPPDIDGDAEGYEVLGWAVEPGDAIAFDYRTLHGAPANHSNTLRRAFSLRLLGDGAVFHRREGVVTSPPFREIKLAPGTPLSGAEFPRI